MTDRRFHVEFPFEIKTYDIDFAGHVNNIVYIRWMEDLRMAVLNRYLPLDGLMAQGLAPIVVSTHINYRRALKLFDPVIGRMWMESLDGIRMKLRCEFETNGTVAAAGEQIGVFIRLADGRPTRPPDAVRQAFS